MNVEYLGDAKHLYENNLRQRYGRAAGCWQWKVHRLEKSLGVQFPAAYREYLLWLGEHRQGPFVGSNCFPEDIKGNNQTLMELLEENRIVFTLPASILVFFMHQGYSAAWFSLQGDSIDPTVWHYSEGTMKNPELYGPFSQWLYEALRDVANVRA